MHQGTRDPTESGERCQVPGVPRCSPAAVDRIFAERISRLRQKSLFLARKKPMAKAKPASPEDGLVDQYLKLKAKSKAIFVEVKDLEEELLALAARGENARITLASGRVLTRKDNFAEKNTQFKQTAMQRFEVVIA